MPLPPHPGSDQLGISSDAQALLSRPQSERIKEFKYRFAQATIFGLPVLALQWGGHLLGGSQVESDRWVALLQAILAGWVTYVAAAGMLAEALIVLSARWSIDLIPAALIVAAYLYSAISTLGVFFLGRPFYEPLFFHVAILLSIIWSGIRWYVLARMPAAVA